MIQEFEPQAGSVLTAQSLEPASDPVSPSLSDPHLLTHILFLKHKQTLKKIFFKKGPSQMLSDSGKGTVLLS